MQPNNVPKSADDPRSRRFQIGLPIEVELFYAAQAEFLRDASTTRAMEQFLIDRSSVPSNIDDLRHRVCYRAIAQNKTPIEVLEEFLIKLKYDKMAGFDVESQAAALCKLWAIPTECNELQDNQDNQ